MRKMNSVWKATFADLTPVTNLERQSNSQPGVYEEAMLPGELAGFLACFFPTFGCLQMGWLCCWIANKASDHRWCSPIKQEKVHHCLLIRELEKGHFDTPVYT